MKGFFTLLLLTCMFTYSQAQFPARNPTPNDTLNSTKVLSDGSVVFSIYAPKASEVTVSGDFQTFLETGRGPVNLSKDGNGIWSYQTERIPSDVYSYTFMVDGVKTLDPLNKLLKESESGYENYFIMPYEGSEYAENLDVPHGKVEKVWFQSEVTGKMTRFHVYTPPGVEDMKDKLPLLVLQHGGGDNDASWSTIGRANFILDNLYAAEEVVPMVVVMPMGHPADGFFMNPGIEDDPYYEQLLTEIIPMARKKYNLREDRFGTAFAGLSMGGLQALNLALFAPEEFGYVLPLSTGYFEAQRKMLVEQYDGALRNPDINTFKLFWISMGGESDIAYENGLAVNKIFDDYGIKYQTNTYNAGHTFITWRHDLLKFAPLLFR